MHFLFTTVAFVLVFSAIDHFYNRLKLIGAKNLSAEITRGEQVIKTTLHGDITYANEAAKKHLQLTIK